jgi:hypothetical protein
MAILFPQSPYVNQTYQSGNSTWTWNGEQWDLSAGTYVTPTGLTTALSSYATQTFVNTALTNSASVSVSDSTPSVTTTGSLWFNSTDCSLYVYYKDGTTNQWIQPAINLYGSGSSGGGTTTLSAATTSQLGGVIIPAVGTSGITNSSGTISLAVADTTQLGGVKVDGTTITINAGVISSALSLSALSDVNTSGAADGQVLKYSTTQSKWIPASDLTGAGGSGIGLTSLSVSVGSPSGTGTMSYNNATGVFTFTPPALSAYATTATLSTYATTASLSSYATTASLNSLIPSQSSHSGQYLTTNGATLSWAAITSNTLSALTDVNISTVSDGQVLKYNSAQGKWTPASDLTTNGGGGVALTSFSVSTAAAGGSGGLYYDNATGVFTFTPPFISVYTLPTATVGTSSTGTLGGVKVDGTTITIANGVISGAQAGVTSVVSGTGYISVNTSNGVVTVSNTLTSLNSLADANALVINGTNLTVDKIAIHAVACYDVLFLGLTAYTMLNFASGNNPTIYALSGTCIAFNLQVIGHPFALQTTGGVDLDWTTTNTYGTLVHVSTQGTVSTGANAQGKVTGTLYWNITPGFSGTVRYQCTLHAAMRGNIVVKSITSLV